MDDLDTKKVKNKNRSHSKPTIRVFKTLLNQSINFEPNLDYFHSLFIFLFQEKLPFPFEHFLQRIARRPRPQQFYGLMGKRDAGKNYLHFVFVLPLSNVLYLNTPQIYFSGYKTDSFVGLMGKRSLNSAFVQYLRQR
uniref:Tachykinin 1 n=1 Tax=Laticauda laticaudata TaxID=8630 RepID=A0A8C5WN70_LATLA